MVWISISKSKVNSDGVGRPSYFVTGSNRNASNVSVNYNIGYWFEIDILNHAKNVLFYSFFWVY